MIKLIKGYGFSLAIVLIRGELAAAENSVTSGPWHLLGRFRINYFEFISGSKFSRNFVSQSYII